MAVKRRTVKRAPQVPAVQTPHVKKVMNINRQAAAHMVGKGSERYKSLDTVLGVHGREINIADYRQPDLMPGVLPKGQTKMALDSAMGASGIMQFDQVGSIYAEGVGFLGFPLMAELCQRSEYLRPSEIVPKEMTRKWIKLHCAGSEEKTEKMQDIEDELKRLGVQALFCKAAELDCKFGRGQIYIDTGDTDNEDELKTPLVDMPEKFGKGKLKALRTIEPIWTYPSQYNAFDPLKADYFKPQSWFVMGKEIHNSRLLTFVGREVSDLLKPAYAFSGISFTQMLVPYVNNWLRTRQSVSDIVCSFSQFVLKTNLSSILNSGSGEQEAARAALFNAGRDNNGLMIVDKDTEDFENIAAPLAGLSDLQAQTQEHCAGVVGLSLIKYFGITPKGLNNSSEGEIQVGDDAILSAQEHLFTPQLSRLLNLVQLSLFGEIDPRIGFTWVPLRTLNEEKLAEVRKTEADTDAMYIDRGVITPEESRIRIAQQPESSYMGLDLSKEIIPPGMEMLEEQEDHAAEEDDNKKDEE